MNGVLKLKDIEKIPMGSFAVIGCPVGHSLSPLLHNALTGKDDYYKILVEPEELKEAAPMLIKRLGGFNCTIPHKLAIMEYVDKLDESAAGYGAVNTVKIHSNGATGYNTDGAGLLTALKRRGLKLSGEVMVLGAGGAARVMAIETLRAGARLTIICRNSEKGEALKSDLMNQIPKGEICVNPLQYKNTYNLIMNATPVGMYPHTEGLAIERELLDRAEGIFDAIYNPPKTRLIIEAEKRGIPAENGVFMLVGQAAEARKIWTGEEFDSFKLESAAQALNEALKENSK
jgi:shikimate dehydrogenase